MYWYIEIIHLKYLAAVFGTTFPSFYRRFVTTHARAVDATPRKKDPPGALACVLLSRLDKGGKKSAVKFWERIQIFPDVTENSHICKVEASFKRNQSQVCVSGD